MIEFYEKALKLQNDKLSNTKRLYEQKKIHFILVEEL